MKRASLNLRAVLVAALLAPTGTAFAQAGGLALPENGGPSNGTAQAGSAAIARDAETAWLNPAGMTRLEQTEILFSAMPFALSIEFNPAPATTTTGGDGGQQGTWLPAGGFFLAAPLNETVAVGFSVTSPAGLILDPDDAWVGRYFVTETQLVALNFQPSIGVRLSDQWSIGAGIDIQYASFEQKIGVNRPGPLPDGKVRIDGDSWEVGWSASLLWEPLETTRFGLRYHSEFDHDLSGDFEALPTFPASTDLRLPRSLTFSAYHDFTRSFALMADIGWQDWSSFDRTIISIDGPGNAQVELPRNFKDTWTFSIGAHVRPAEKWLLMFGGGYTSAAVDDEDRTPDMPVDEQVRLSVGVEYEINEQWRVGGNYTFIWLGDNDLDAQLNPSTGRVVGDYDAYVHALGVYASLRF